MTTTKHPYLKEILKTTAKVALMAGATILATPYAFGFAAGLLNLLPAGYVAGGIVAGIGTMTTLKTLAKDVMSMRGRVQKQQRAEQVDNKLQALGHKLGQIQAKQNQLEQKGKLPNLIARHQINWKTRRAKNYDRAA